MIIRDLTISDASDMAKLLAYRHKEERVKFQALNKIFEDETVLESIVEKKIHKKRTIAIGAYQGDTLLGFIMSNVIQDTVFGRCAWVKYDGLALAEGTDATLYRDLYATISKKWINIGCLKHFVIVPAGQNEVMNSWLNSGFAYEQVFGIKELELPNINKIEGICIREASVKDKKDIESISGLILSFQAQTPTCAIALPEMFEELKKGYGGLIEDQEAHLMLAYQEDDFLGFTCGYFEDEDKENMITPYKNVELGVAGTNPSFQNRGVGTLLTLSLFKDAFIAGYENSTTDWRITNMKSSVFWPKMGYKPYAYRIVRTIDRRIYWADGDKRL